MKSKKEVGQVIKQFRKENGYTRRELAEQCSISDRTIYYYEKGRYYPGFEALTAFKRIGMNLDKLLG